MVKAVPTTDVNSGQSKILRNTSYLTGAFVLQKLISFVYYTVVVNSIGVSKTGEYGPLKSLIPIALILIDFSLSQVLTREVARRPGSVKSLLGHVLGIKLLFAIVVLATFGFVTNFGNFTQDVQSSLYLVALIVGFDTFTLSFFAVLRGLQNMKYEAAGMILNQIVSVTIGYITLKLGLGFQGVFFATLLGSVLNFGWSIFAIRHFLKIWPRLVWESKFIKDLLKMALPFAIAAMLVKVYTYADRWLLIAIKGKEAVAFYEVAHKLTFALEFLPSAFAAGLYPALSSYYVDAKEKLQHTFERALFYMMIIAVPLSIFIFVAAEEVLGLAFKPFFQPAAEPLRILILSLPVIFMNFPVGTLLNATNRTRLNTVSMAITVLVNISLNALLLQKFSYMGSAIATLISGITLFSLGMYWTKGVTHIPWKSLGIRLAKIYGAAIVAGIAAYPVLQAFDWIVYQRHAEVVLAGVVFLIIYTLALYLFRGIHPSEFAAVRNAFLRRRSA